MSDPFFQETSPPLLRVSTLIFATLKSLLSNRLAKCWASDVLPAVIFQQLFRVSPCCHLDQCANDTRPCDLAQKYYYSEVRADNAAVKRLLLLQPVDTLNNKRISGE